MALLPTVVELFDCQFCTIVAKLSAIVSFFVPLPEANFQMMRHNIYQVTMIFSANAVNAVAKATMGLIG